MPRRLTHSQEGRNEKAAPHGGYCNAGVVVRHSGARSTGALVRSGATLVVGGPAADKSNCGAPKERADSKGQGAEGTTAMICDVIVGAPTVRAWPRPRASES